MGILQVVVTGGAGQIAYSLIPLIARGIVFGPDTKVHLRLLDIPPAAQALEGVAMEVQDSLFGSVVEGVLPTTDEAEAFSGAQVAILLGGFPRRPGMERGDLIGKNAGIMKRMGMALEKYACRNCKVIVVANPAPTNCFVLAVNAPSLPRSNFSCLSRLDHDRMVGMLLEKASRNIFESGGQGSGFGKAELLGPADVRGACVWGNHSNSQVPDVSVVEFRVNGRWVPANSVIRDAAWLALWHPNTTPDLVSRTSAANGSGEDNLAEAVRGRGAAVLTARKLSSAMSAANAICAHLSDWLTSGSSASKVVSMGVFADGNPWGLPDGLVSSFPVRCGVGVWEFADGFRLSEEASRQLDESVATGEVTFTGGFSLNEGTSRLLEASVAELEQEKEMALAMLQEQEDRSLPPPAPSKTSEHQPTSCL